jgi:replicative DNA helicase
MILRETKPAPTTRTLVLFLHRPDYYDLTDQPGWAEVSVAKNRNGPTAAVRLAFTKNLMRFDSLETSAENRSQSVYQ